ncbi:MAG TPA: universal stress protein [Syntrophorhabdales bacterium]|nr:universal stress protein [Syntrophorhabdales bacterium]
MDDVKRILVVSRDTTECKKAVHMGVSLAKKYGAELSVVHVFHNVFGLKGGVLYIPHLADLEQTYKNMVKEVKQDIDRIIAEEKAAGMKIKEMVKDGDPAEVIIRTIQEEKADLMIMARHEEGRIEHILYYRGIDEVTRKMPCSILLVKAEPFSEA